MDMYIARAINRVSQWELARRTGISQAQLSLFERGYREPSEEAKVKIAAAIGISADRIEWLRTEIKGAIND